MNEPNGGAPETEELTEQQVSELIQIRRDKLTARGTPDRIPLR